LGYRENNYLDNYSRKYNDYSIELAKLNAIDTPLKHLVFN